MIRVNLLPVKETQQAQRQRQELSLVVLGLIFMLLVFVAIRIHQGRRMGTLDRQIGDLKQSVDALEKRVRDVADLDQKRKELDAKLKVIAELGRKRIGPAAVLNELADATPDRAWLSDLSEVKGAATLTGLAVDNQTIAEFLRRLSASPYFTNVDLVETTQDVSGDVKLRKFLIKAQINYAAGAAKDEGHKAAPAAGAPR